MEPEGVTKLDAKPIPMEVPVEELADHPMNDNQMSPGMERKLQAHIQANGGLYPRIICRELHEGSKYFVEDGPKYQIIDGHQRKPNLVALGIRMIQVDVWPDKDDADALRLLASMNKLHGTSVPVKRATLIQEFKVEFPEIEDIEVYLVETPEEIEGFEKIFEADSREVEEETQGAVDQAAKALDNSLEWVTLDPFTVTKAQESIIKAGLEKIVGQLKGGNKRGRALELVFADFLAGSGEVSDELREA